MKEYQYQLDKTSKKSICPQCQKKTFVLYTDTETKNYLPDKYGRCDRAVNCGYHLNPYKDGYGKENRKRTYIKPIVQTKPKERYYIPESVLNDTLKGYGQNCFIQNLLKNVPYPFEISDLKKLIELYKIGTVTKGFLSGAVTLPFIDHENNVFAIQVKKFNEMNKTIATNHLPTMIAKYHHENNKPLPEWLTNYQANESNYNCLFGSQLLKQYPKNKVFIVESPKNALIGCLYHGLPNENNPLWLSTYNIGTFKLDAVKCLKGRTVIVIPDTSTGSKAFQQWQAKAQQFNRLIPGAKFIMFDYLEKAATEQEKKDGLDIADFLIKRDWRQTRTQTGH